MLFLSQKAPFEKIELLSVHIPKTAGISFLKVLEKEYGKALFKVYKASLVTKINEGNLHRIPSSTRVLHGHFEINELNRHTFPNARIICWLRHPVDRLISHYNYWFTYPPHGNPFHDKFLREKPTLREFIEDPEYKSTINTYQSFLGALQPEDFFFVGRTEHFSEDLKTLSNLFGWKSFLSEAPSENIGPTTPLPEDITRDELEDHLRAEMALYQNLIHRFHP